MKNLLIIIVALAVIGGGGYFFLQGGKPSNTLPGTQNIPNFPNPNPNQNTSTPTVPITNPTTTNTTPSTSTNQNTPKPTPTTTPVPKPNPAPTVPKTPTVPTVSSYTIDEIAMHDSEVSCWSAINGNVYDLTSWIDQHPGGSSAIKRLCGIDGSEAFNNQHGGSASQESQLASFKIGIVKK